MNFSQCPNCKLSLPTYKLLPVVAVVNGRRTKIKLCEYCIKLLKEKQGNK